jgi:polyhydroxyalkanoate synthesis regulator phasin
MPFDGILGNPLLRKALRAGEEQVGKVVGKLLSNEGVAAGVQTLISGAVQARATLERGVSQALHAANLPSRDDVDALRRKLDELEAMLDGLAEKVERDRGGKGGGSGGGE